MTPQQAPVPRRPPNSPARAPASPQAHEAGTGMLSKLSINRSIRPVSQSFTAGRPSRRNPDNPLPNAQRRCCHHPHPPPSTIRSIAHHPSPIPPGPPLLTLLGWLLSIRRHQIPQNRLLQPPNNAHFASPLLPSFIHPSLGSCLSLFSWHSPSLPSKPPPRLLSSFALSLLHLPPTYHPRTCQFPAHFLFSSRSLSSLLHAPFLHHLPSHPRALSLPPSLSLPNNIATRGFR